MSMKPQLNTVLFDLDGTLVDSASGIRKSLESGLESLGVASPGEKELESVIGLTFSTIWPMLTGVTDSHKQWQSNAAHGQEDEEGEHQHLHQTTDFRCVVGGQPGLQKLRAQDHQVAADHEHQAERYLTPLT